MEMNRIVQGHGCVEPSVSYELLSLPDACLPRSPGHRPAIDFGEQLLGHFPDARRLHTRPARSSPGIATLDMAHDTLLCLAHDTAHGSGSGFGINTLVAHLTREGLTPGLQVCLARIEPASVEAGNPDRQVNVRMRLVRMQDEHIFMVRTKSPFRVRARRVTYSCFWRTFGHRENQVHRVTLVFVPG